MRRTPRVAIAITLAASVSSSGAQSIAQRISRADGVVEVIYPSRPTVCGNGRDMIGHVFGRSTTYSGGVSTTVGSTWSRGPCEPGPARAEVSVASGEITRIQPNVGPLASLHSNVQTLNVSAAEASAWLSELVLKGDGRVASDAMLPLLLAEGNEPWPLFLRIARDENRSRATRRIALTWLASGITDKLGLSVEDAAPTADDQMREEAVFVLTQRPKSESVPELIDLAKNGTYPSVRRSAIFWLGQTDDPRATDTYAALLNLR